MTDDGVTLTLSTPREILVRAARDAQAGDAAAGAYLGDLVARALRDLDGDAATDRAADPTDLGDPEGAEAVALAPESAVADEARRGR